MRAAIISKRFPPETCGVGDYTLRLGEILADHGEQVTVFTELYPGARPPQVRVVESPMTGWCDLRSLLRAILAENPDRVQLEYSAYGWGRWGFAFWVNALLAILRWRGIPVTLALHETAIRFRQHPGRIPIAVIQRVHIMLLMWAAQIVVTNTPERMRVLRRWLPFQQHKLRYRPNASNVRVTPVSLDQRMHLRAQCGAQADTLVVATFGNFASAKNYEAVIEAVAMLRPRHPLHLWLLGEWRQAQPEYIQKLRTRIAQLGLENHVDWSGYLPEEQMSARLAAADLFVLPQSDGHLTRSGAFMAAAAHGLPVIAVRNYENQQEFAHGQNVWLVERSKPEDLAEGIRALAASSETREILGRNLRALYAARFDWSVQLAAGTECSPPKIDPVATQARAHTVGDKLQGAAK